MTRWWSLRGEEHPDTLLELDLQSPCAGPRGMRKVAAAFSRGACPNLQDLRLHKMPLMDEGVIELARGMKADALPKMSWLDLEGVGMGAAGRAALCDARSDGEVCPELEWLTLSHEKPIPPEEKAACEGQVAARRSGRQKVKLEWPKWRPKADD